MKKLPFTFWFILIVFGALSQNTTISLTDSLKIKLRQAKTDTAKIKLLDRLSYEYSRSDYTQGIDYGEQAEALALKNYWKKEVAGANISLGLNYVGKCDYKKAIYHYTKALEIYKGQNNKEGLSSVYANMALMYIAQSDYSKALDYNFKALSIFEEINNVQKKAIVLENIGTVYLEQGKHSKALEYYSHALENYRLIKDNNGIARNLANQGIILNTQGEYKKALGYHQQALNVNQENEDWNSAQINLANIGITYCYLKQYSLALTHHLKALDLSKKLNDTRSIAINLGNIGELYYSMAEDNTKDLKRNEYLLHAIEYLEKAILTCKEIAFDGPCIEFSQFLYKAYQLSGNYKQALAVFGEYTSLRDSVFSQEARLKMAAIEAKREIEIKNKDIILKERQIEIEKLQVINRNNERVIFSGAIGLLFVIILSLYRLFRLRINRHKKILSDIAYIQSHQVRAPLARILGLSKLFDQKNVAADINKKVVNMMHQSALELDAIVRKTVSKASEDN